MGLSFVVRDNAGVIPGASVKITNSETGVSQNLPTNESGYFEASFLNPGTYAVSVQMPGYKAVVRDQITLGVGEQVTVPFTLEVVRPLPAAIVLLPGLLEVVRADPRRRPHMSVTRHLT